MSCEEQLHCIGTQHHVPVAAHVGRYLFSETAHSVIDFLQQCRCGYGNSVLHKKQSHYSRENNNQ